MEYIFTTETNREIRVFLSSTFRDMMSERDYLIKEVFPELSHRCHQRGLELTDIDLRWGVTKEHLLIILLILTLFL